MRVTLASVPLDHKRSMLVRLELPADAAAATWARRLVTSYLCRCTSGCRCRCHEACKGATLAGGQLSGGAALHQPPPVQDQQAIAVQDGVNTARRHPVG